MIVHHCQGCANHKTWDYCKVPLLSCPGVVTDDPETDTTDFAHPAWWRGEKSGVYGACREIQKVLNGDMGGSCYEPLEAIRQQVRMLKSECDTWRKYTQTMEGTKMTDKDDLPPMDRAIYLLEKIKKEVTDVGKVLVIARELALVQSEVELGEKKC